MTHVLIIGGSSGMGLALAKRLRSDGADVTVAGRSAARLTAAADLVAGLRRAQADITDEPQVRRLLSDSAPLDHIVVTAVDVDGAYAPLKNFGLDAARAVVNTKLLGPWLVAKHAAVNPGGSITFTSGAAAYRPGPGGSMIATVNGALESMARALALELAPVRVNVVSPGWVDTPIWETLAGDAKPDRFADMAKRLPAGRIGTPDDIAEAFIAVLRNTFMTGSVLHVDGGHRIA